MNRRTLLGLPILFFIAVYLNSNDSVPQARMIEIALPSTDGGKDGSTYSDFTVYDVDDLNTNKQILSLRTFSRNKKLQRGKNNPPIDNQREEDEKTSIDYNGKSPCDYSRKKEMPGFTNGLRFQYIHVPKAGGTSIQAAITAWVSASQGRAKLLLENGNSFKGSSFACPPGTMDSSIFIGHRGYGFCQGVERHAKGLFTFVVLRSAVSRMISLYDYNLRMANPRALRLFRGKNLNNLIKIYNRTEKMEEGEFILRYSGTQQVRFLCGYECMGPNAYKNETITLNFMMERAIANLNKVDVVGITEELQKVIPQLKFHMNLVPPRFGKWPESNEAPSRKPYLDAESLSILEEWGSADEVLWEIGKKIYSRQRQIAIDCLKEKQQQS